MSRSIIIREPGYGKLFIFSIFLASVALTLPNCDSTQPSGIESSLDPIPELAVIEGAENAAFTINRGVNSYFSIEVSNIEPNPFIAGGIANGWYMNWTIPIESDNTTLKGLKLYSSFGDDKWKAVNYLLNIRASLMSEIDGLTYREIQAAIWTLLDFPEFDLDTVRAGQLPGDMAENGQFNFDIQKVNQIVNHVNDNYESFQYSAVSAYAVIAETPSNTQPIILEVPESVWAFGRHSFRDPELRNALGITGEGKGQWGWIYEPDHGFTQSVTELIAAGSDDDGSKPAEEIGIVAGNLIMNKTGNILEVIFHAFPAFMFDDIYFWAGCSPADFPGVGSSGNITPGRFPYYFNEEVQDSFTFEIDLNNHINNCPGNLFISAHAGRLYRKMSFDFPDDPATAPVFDILDLSEAYGLTEARFINNAGHIVNGHSYWNRETGQITDMGINPVALNDQGQVLGKKTNLEPGEWSAVIWEENKELIVLESPFDGNYDYEFLDARDINNHGQVAGEVETEQHIYDTTGDDFYIEYDWQGFIWNPENDGSYDLMISNSWANSINDHGQIVGAMSGEYVVWSPYTGEHWLEHGEYWWADAHKINNQAQVIGEVFEAPVAGRLAAAINRRPLQVVKAVNKLKKLKGAEGMYYHRHIHEMIRNSTSLTDKLPVSVDLHHRELKESDSFSVNQPASQMPDILQSLENTDFKAAIWDEQAGMVLMGTLGGEWSRAYDINDHGQVVGYSSIGGEEFRAFYWDFEHGMIEIPGYGGNSSAFSINNNGQIVGYSYDTEGSYHPVQWTISTNP